MSMADYDRARAMLAASSAVVHFAGPRPPALVDKAEATLGLRYPESYRRFLLEYGAGSVGPAEFYGVIDEHWDDSSVPDGVWYTRSERKQSRLPDHFVVVGDTGGGMLYVIDTSEPGGPVYVLAPWDLAAVRQRVADDFGAYFLQRVSAVLG
jgi:antitoxin YobK